jgi:hypothetical protein
LMELRLAGNYLTSIDAVDFSRMSKLTKLEVGCCDPQF